MVLGFVATPAPLQGSTEFVSAMKLNGLIHGATVDHVQLSIDKAYQSRAQALIIEIDTPGGLLDSTLEIVKLLLNSPIPVLVYVSPPGAQAGSAGVIITMAGHIAAMAPGTNIGAATPVSIQGELPEEMKKKVTQHTASYIETIAEQRNRNREWARKAVIDAESITCREAEENGVIDFVAKDLSDLLAKADGRLVEVKGKEQQLNTKGLRVVEIKLDWKERFKLGLASPSLAFLLLIVAILGIYLEFSHPGLILPGTVGVLSAILFLFSIQIIPFNYLGLALIILGIVCFVLEMKVTSYGLLSVAGLISFAFGSLLLFDVPDQMFDPRSGASFRVPLSLVLPATLGLGLFVVGVMAMVIRVHRRAVLTAFEGMVGQIGTVKKALEPGRVGQVFLHGELWRAISDEPVETGQAVVVTSCDSLIVKVKRFNGQ
ncbi:MAG: nodulation protein NfeD [Deltaproteobacteria bacterium]|nr:nodulation protein NfeD [Deltaproteobacteria bacterium]